MTERLRLDVRFRSAHRALGHAPATVASAVLTLAVAPGLNLAMFGLIDRALLSPPAHVADADRVFTLGFEVPRTSGPPARMTTTSYVIFDAIRGNMADGGSAAAWRVIGDESTSVAAAGVLCGADAARRRARDVPPRAQRITRRPACALARRVTNRGS